MADDLGSASVTITPDLAKFATDLRAGLAATDAGKVDVGLNVDEEKLDEFKAQVSAYNAVIGVGVKVDDAKLKEIQAELDAFGLEHKTATADVDDHGVKEKLEEDKKAADGAGESFKKLKESAGEAGGPGGFGALVTGILTLGPALFPIAGVATAAAVGLAGAFTAATVGLGAFALAAKNDLPQVTSAVNDAVNAFGKLTAPDVMPVLQGAVSLLTPALHALAPVVHEVSGALLDLEASARTSLGGTTFTSFISFIQSNAGPAILAFGHLFGGLGTAITDALIVAQPLITSVDGALTKLGNDFSNWGAGAATGGFQSFISTMQSEGPLVESTLKSLAGIFVSLTKGANDLGVGLLTVLNPMLEFVNLALKFGGPGVAAVALGIVGVTVAIQKLAPVLEGASVAMQKFGLAMATLAAGGEAEGAAGFIARMVTALGGLGPALLVVGGGLAILGGAFALFKFLADEQTGAVEKLTGGFEKLATNSLVGAQRAFADTTAQLQKIKPAADAVTDSLSNTSDRARQLVEQFNPLLIAQRDLEAEQARAKTAMDNYAKGTDTLASKFHISKDAADQLAQSMGINLTKALSSTQIEDMSKRLDLMAQKTGISSDSMLKLATQTGQTTATIAKQLPQQAAAVGLTTQAFADLEIQSGQTGAAIVSLVTGAMSATASSFSSFSSVVQNFSGYLAVSGDAITTFFSTHVDEANKFGANLTQAIKDGYNPILINQILQAGPAQAGATLQSLIDNYSESFKTEVNSGVSALSQLQTAAVEQSRLVALATTKNSDQMVSDLSTAMAIDQEKAVEGASASAGAVAKALGLGLPEVQRISGEFGITLPTKLQEQQVAAYLAALAQGNAAKAGLDGSKPGIINSADEIAGITAKSLAKSPPDAFAKGLNTGGQFASGIGETTQTAAAVVDLHASGAVAKFEKGPQAKTAGTNTGAAWAAGITSQTGAATTAANAVVTASTNEFNAHQDRARGFGSATSTAFVQGISSQQGAATSAVSVLTVTALGQFNAHQNLARTYGGNEVTAGFVAGITAQQGSATAAVDAFTKSAIAPFNAHQNLAGIYGTNTANAWVRGITSTGSGGIDGWVRTAIGPMNAHQDLAATYGSNTAGGFVRGVQSQAGAAAAAAASVAQAAIAQLAAVPKIASPSKVTMGLGQFFGQGFTIGITGSIPAAAAAATAMASAATRALQIESYIYNDQRIITALTAQLAASTTTAEQAGGITAEIRGLQRNIVLAEAQATQLRQQALPVAPIPLGTPLRPYGGAQRTDVPGTEAAAGVNFSPVYNVTITAIPGPGQSPHDVAAAQFQQMLAEHDQQLLNELTAVGARA
jgi:hypothetical protein